MMKWFPEHLLKNKFKFYFLQSIALMFIVNSLKHYRWGNVFLLHQIMVFEILYDLQEKEGKTIIMVEQNAKKGLEFADIGYVLVAGELALAGKGNELLENPEVGRLFLGG